ncbi:3-dehydroquinate synthase [Pleomorphochaeta sp. DL1XJH-081]|uniref:3-dehydroquinate synthase n=1 Tax=Pleomorphochaeta sp. DL1XJH-081 TaxID=3409690 RepID=UPI003BB808FE
MQKLNSCVLGDRVSHVHAIESVEEIIGYYGDRDTGVLWVCDTNTRKYVPKGVACIELPCGELAKRWESIEAIITEALRNSLARDSRFIAVGGGVICDMTAFAASIYMRGCSVSLVPTTLLAMVDASLGGKTAIDLLGAKNLVGTFYPADDIFLFADALQTLPDAEFKNGLGEVLKHSLLASTTELKDFLQKNRISLLDRDRKTMENMIWNSLEVKRSYIERDPTEKLGIRDALNLGHTFAHALESIGNMSRWSHGEAVAWGVVKALETGLQLEITPRSFSDTYTALFSDYGFHTDLQITDTNAFIQALASDKKRRQSQIRFVLMEGQGLPITQPVPHDLIQTIIS